MKSILVLAVLVLLVPGAAPVPAAHDDPADLTPCHLLCCPDDPENPDLGEGNAGDRGGSPSPAAVVIGVLWDVVVHVVVP